MGYLRTPYDDADTTDTMRADCTVAAVTLPLQDSRPSHRDKVKREITIDEATARLAAAIDLGR